MDTRQLEKKRERWYAFDSVEPMFKSIGTQLPVRLRRLFCTACCRRVWPLIPDDESRRHIDSAEADADREISKDEHDAHWGRVVLATKQIRPWMRTAAVCARVGGCNGTSGAVTMAVSEAGGNRREEENAHADLLRDIVGEWFYPVTFQQEWRSPHTVELATFIYDNRAFDRLIELSELLARDGCTEPRVLAHCLSPGPHVRGCWVVDGVLALR